MDMDTDTDTDTPMHKDNVPKWDGTSQGFYEVWYWKFNLPSGEGLWLRLTTLSPKNQAFPDAIPMAQVWGVFFDAPETKESEKKKIALKTTYPITDFHFSKNDQKISIGKNFWGPDKTIGKITENNHEIEWDLSYDANDFTFFHVPSVLQKTKLAKSTVCKPNVNIFFTGHFKIDGKMYAVNQAAGCQGHIWGKDYAHDWAWAHANIFDNPDVCVEMLSARVKLAGLVVSPYMSALYLRVKDQAWEFNSLVDALSIKMNFTPERWQLQATRDGTHILIEVQAPDSLFSGVTYHTPQNLDYFCYNTALANMTVTITFASGATQVYSSMKKASFETVSADKIERMSLLI